VWRWVTSSTDNCLGQDCPSLESCCVLRARREAQEADLVVINHHLFFADLALRGEGFGEILPSADAVVMDEAHQLPEVATQFFGVSLSARQILDLTRDAGLAREREAGDVAALPHRLRAVEAGVRALRETLGGDGQRQLWSDLVTWPGVAGAVGRLDAALDALDQALGALAERGKDLDACHRRSQVQLERLRAMAPPEQADEHLRWAETQGRGFSLHRTPLDVGRLFGSHLQERRAAWVFTSATLAVGERFDHFAGRMGIAQWRSGLWESPFDFSRQALCYLPTGLPDPNHPDYTAALVEAALPVLAASRGRAFLLFTSHRALQEAARRLTGRVPFALLIQGDSPRTQLLERFRTTSGAVLLGTSSFWEGIDVRGEALSCVIIDRLPFAVPDDPLLRARHQAIRERGGNPFTEDQLPQAVITLKQGAGRLIRDITDRGVLMLCDPRLVSRGYGRAFLDSLPPMPRTRALDDVRRFFGEAGP
jgi:ATP-dependent DNA helicase DinG